MNAVPGALWVCGLWAASRALEVRWLETRSYEALRGLLERLGCVWIKLGQWVSAREDLVPHELAVVLRELRETAPRHPFESTRLAVEGSLGGSLESLFTSFEASPVASGSVGQVHRAVLRGHLSPTGAPMEVAVKVRHPGVAEDLNADLDLLGVANRAAGWCLGALGLDGFVPPVDVRAFGESLRKQTDFRVEARNLERFRHQFARSSVPVSFPAPVQGLVSDCVLVESWERGESIQRYVDRGHRRNHDLAVAGHSLFLSMLLHHNFLHADAHAGNIFVTRVRPGEAKLWDVVTSTVRFWLPEALKELVGNALAPDLRFVVLDAGLVTELPDHARDRFRRLLACIFLADGPGAADQFIALSERGCHDPDALRHDMHLLFLATIGSPLQRQGANVGHLIREMLSLVNAHGMRLDVDFASVVVSLTVLEGLARSLDPEIDLIQRLAPFLIRELAALIDAAAHELSAAPPPWEVSSTPDGVVLPPW